jgi:glutathione S-transferase
MFCGLFAGRGKVYLRIRKTDRDTMKLHDGGRAPNPRRVRIFLAEKGLPLPTLVPVDLNRHEHRSDDFRRLNPYQGLPVLELDDGTTISESVAICRYFEELHPEPALFGVGPLERTLVEMWNRRIEFGLYAAVQAVFRHSHPGALWLEAKQVPDWAELNRPRVFQHLKLLDDQLSRHTYVAGERFTIADISAFIAVDFMRINRTAIPEEMAGLARWKAAVGARQTIAA